MTLQNFNLNFTEKKAKKLFKICKSSQFLKDSSKFLVHILGENSQNFIRFAEVQNFRIKFHLKISKTL